MARLIARSWIALLVSPAQRALACPGCWSALANSPEGMRIAGGFRNGIVFLLIVPFILVGAVAYQVYRSQRNAVRVQVEPRLPEDSCVLTFANKHR